jgi:outer membrane protein TolC
VPRTQKSLDLARSDYAKGNVNLATAVSAKREVRQSQLQIAQVSAELSVALTLLAPPSVDLIRTF